MFVYLIHLIVPQSTHTKSDVCFLLMTLGETTISRLLVKSS